MKLNRNDLQHMTTVQHEGKVLLFGINSRREIYYAVKQIQPPRSDQQQTTTSNGEANSSTQAPPADLNPWRDWQRLSFPDDATGDPSVTAREQAEGTYEFVRSLYNTADQTALAPIQPLSDGEHLYVFRQSVSGTLLCDRFVLDGGTDRLVRKLEVRFKRSRQKYEPLRPSGSGRNREFDAPDFRDFRGEFFFEPTTELRLINALSNGWFSVALVNTSEHDIHRWHIFAHDGNNSIVLTSLRRSANLLFDLRDQTIEEGTFDSPLSRQIPGVIRRRFSFQNQTGEVLVPQDAPVATTYCLQNQVTTGDGDTSLVKAGVRVMLAVPAGNARKPVVLSFAVRSDGTLAEIDRQPQQTLLQEQNQEVLLSADLLHQVSSQSDDRREAPVPLAQVGLAFDGVNDFVTLGSDRSLNVTNQFSLEAWIYPTSLQGRRQIFAKPGAYSVGIENGQVMIAIGQQTYRTTVANLAVETWYHLAVVREINQTVHIYLNGELLQSIQNTVAAPIGQQPARIGTLDGRSEFWQGQLAEVRLWNTAIIQAEVQQRRNQTLLGREFGLVGYWTLQGVANGETADFSPQTNTGIVSGAYPAGSTWQRNLSDGATVTAYRNDEVFSVTQGATYLESFEYRTDAPQIPFDEATETFQFVFWGRSNGREGQTTEPVQIPAEIQPLNAPDDGWRIARARYTIPAGMTHLRHFQITPPGGSWSRLEVRKHRMEQLIDTITQAEYTDAVTLTSLADQYAEAEQALLQIPALEAEEAELNLRLQELEALLGSGNPEATLRADLDRLTAQRQTLQTQRSQAVTQEFNERANPFNRYAAIGAFQREGVRLHYDGNRLSLQLSNNSNRQEWKFVQRGQDSAGIFYSIHSRYDENQVLMADPTSQDRSVRVETYTGLSRQVWRVNLLQGGNPARVQIQASTNPSQVLSIVRRNNSDTLVLSLSSATAEKDWALIDQGNLHPEGQARINAAQAEVTRLNGAIATLDQELSTKQRELDNVTTLSDRRNQTRSALNTVQQDLRTRRDAVLRQIANLTNTAPDLPVIPTTDGGIVKGAVLEFVTSADRITAFESVEAAVHLNFLDTRGRLRTAIYDAIRQEWRITIPGACLEFRSNPNNRVQIDRFGQDSVRAISVECWVRTSDRSRSGSIVSYTGTTSNSALLIENPTNLQVRLNGQMAVNTGVNIADGEWHHLVMTWESLMGALTLYRDGERVYQGQAARGELLRLGGTLNLGQGLVGFLENVRIWNLALSPTEVEANLHLPLRGDEPGLLADWTLNQISNNQVLDQSPQSYHGTLQGEVVPAPSTAPIGVLPQTVLQFNGTNSQRIEIAHQTRLNLTNNFTLEAWFKLDTITGRKRIFSKEGAYSFGVDGDRLIFTTRFRQDYITTKVNLSAGRWYHVSVVFDNSNDASFYLNGRFIDRIEGSQPAATSTLPGRIAALDATLEFWQGQLAEVRIWNRVRNQAEIAATWFRRLEGTEAGLVAYWRLDQVITSENRVIDRVGNLPGTATGQITALSTRSLPLQTPIRTALIVNEYPTQEQDDLGRPQSLMRRFYAFLQPDAICTLMDQRIEELEVRWIGNAQFDPTLLGYIEGAPPVPSENLTVEENYNSAAAVQLNATEEVSFSWRRAQEAGLGLDVEAILGSYASASAEIPIIGGLSTTVEGGVGFAGNLSTSYSLLDEGAVTTSISSSFSDRLELRGEPEPTAQFPHLGRRFVPKNIGYALVVSSLADVFVLRLKRSRKMVSYQVVPVPDLPPEVNTITFLINPTYLKNGTLDGQVGTEAADDRNYAQVPAMRAQFGSRFPASYFRIREAAQLQARIRQEDRDREAFFTNFNSRLVDETSLNRSVGNVTEDNLESQTGDAQSQIRGQQRNVQSSSAETGWQRRLEDLLIRSRKRNIVNTYVWDGDGGIRSETQEFASTIEQTIGGSFSLDGGIGVTGILRGLGTWVELTALATAHLTQTMTKTETRSQGFGLNVELNGEQRGITTANDTPVLPGEKVDRYRFSSFYLEPSTDHFNDFFQQVVDPEWLMSNDEEARSLRQIQGTRPNKTWRVRHLVTFVERPALSSFGSTAQTLRANSALPIAVSNQAIDNGQFSASNQPVPVN
jgi:hypothetical protein